MVYLTRVEHFNAAHRLSNPGWSPEQHDAAFGGGANDQWHGHNYVLHVTIKGEASPETGFVVDAKWFSELIRIHVIEKLDHTNLNTDVEFMRGKVCSTENLSMGIWHELAAKMPPGVRLHCIRLYETDRIYVDYFGEDG